jgi:hypothetical protein
VDSTKINSYEKATPKSKINDDQVAPIGVVILAMVIRLNSIIRKIVAMFIYS